VCLAPLRRYSEAIEQLNLALRDDPVSAVLRVSLAQTLVLAGQPDAAIEELDQVLDLDPGYGFGHLTLALALEAKERYQEAVDVLVPVRASIGELPNYAGYLGYAYGRLGRRAEAELLRQQLLDRFPGPWVPGYDVALICNGLGERESTLHWLEKAGNQRSFDVTCVRDDPRFGNFHADADFLAVLRRIGLE
jgi:tetratricopeptide (TPR) repeat protein